MKPVKEVEKDRISYYKNSNLNTVHRSSLLIPKLEGNKTLISFINHYLIKRGYKDVILKLTAYDKNGISSDAITYELNSEKVYTYYLEKIFGENYNSYQAEFFSSKNLYIPYPAVMINHIGNCSINTVHAYNRILNDPRELEKINTIKVREASMDVIINEELDTFFILHSGILPLTEANLQIELKSAKTKKKYTINSIINMTKMNTMKFNLSKLISENIKEKIIKKDFTLTITQPEQPLFYGRLLSGVEKKDTLSFSGNHSFYDNSNYEEYFSNKKSYKTFPYFKGYKNIVRIYPIMSPSFGEIDLYLNLKNNNQIKSTKLKTYKFKNIFKPLEIDINSIISNNQINNCPSTFTLIYRSNKNSKVPTRFNMQLVYGSEENTEVDASINQSLYNNELFLAKGKKSFTWSQIVNDINYLSNLGFCFIDDINISRSIKRNIEVDFYDEDGHLEKKLFELNPLDSIIINKLHFNSKSKFIWITAKSDYPQLHFFTIHTNKSTGFTSGEHNF